MEAVTLPAKRREHLGTKHTRRLRQTGQLPAVIYGHGQESVPVAVDAHEVEKLLHHHSRLLSLDIDGQAESYLIKAVQYDYLDTTPIHMDLVRVDMDERVQVTVEVVLRGTPEGAHEGGVIQLLQNELSVECVVTAIPENISLSVTHMKLDDAIAVKDITVEDGVTILADPEDKIVLCRMPTETAEEEPEEGEGEEASSAEPEVIGKGKDEEGGSE